MATMQAQIVRTRAAEKRLSEAVLALSKLYAKFDAPAVEAAIERQTETQHLAKTPADAAIHYAETLSALLAALAGISEPETDG